MAENTAVPLVDETATTSDERTMAVLAQVLQLLGGWIAPLIIFFVKRQSRFITFHALQVLLFEGVCLFLSMLAMMGFFVAMALGITLGGFSSQHPSAPPAAFFLFFGFFWLAFVLLWFLKLSLAIIYGGQSRPRRVGRIPAARTVSPAHSAHRAGWRIH